MSARVMKQLAALACSVVVTLGWHHDADAAVSIVAQENGSGVVFTSQGSLNTSGLAQGNPGGSLGFVAPGVGSLGLGSDPGAFPQVVPYTRGVGPGNFGTGPFQNATSGSGPRWVVGGNGVINLPVDYTGGSLDATLVFANATIESLGLRPGTYEWTLPEDRISLTITPVPAALPPPRHGIGGFRMDGIASAQVRLNPRTALHRYSTAPRERQDCRQPNAG